MCVKKSLTENKAEINIKLDITMNTRELMTVLFKDLENEKVLDLFYLYSSEHKRIEKKIKNYELIFNHWLKVNTGLNIVGKCTQK